MFVHFYNKNQDIPKNESIYSYENIFKEYNTKIPTLYEALYQMYHSLDITDQKSDSIIKFILEKAQKFIQFNYDIIKEDNPFLTKEDAMIIYSYTCEVFDSNYSIYKIVNNNLNEVNRLKGINNISKYFFIFLKSLRKLNRYYPKEKYMYRCINKQINLKKDLFDERIVPYDKGAVKTFYGFLSITSREDMTYDLKGKRKKDDKGTIFQISGKFRGYDISLFNKLIDEHIILEPEHIIKIINVVPPIKNNEIIHINCNIEKPPLLLKGMIKTNKIKIYYQYKKNDEKLIRFLGETFINNNKKNRNFKIVYNNKEYPHGSIDISKEKNNSLQIILDGISNITDLSYMFADCSSIISISIPNFSKITNITNISNMFYNCKSLLSLDFIDKMNTSNVEDFSCLFYNCNSIKVLPDISNWVTSKAIDMSYIFYGCSSLKYLPDISKWKTNYATNMSSLFYGCSLLENLPDISKWNFSAVIDISKMFYKCKSLLVLPDISIWDTSNIKYMNCLFYECSSLLFLPDISKWITSEVTNMSCLFYKCSSLSYLQNISNWNISNVTNLNYIFYGCSSLSYLPNLSNWDISKAMNVKEFIYIFWECPSLSFLPFLSEYNKKMKNVNNINCLDLDI